MTGVDAIPRIVRYGEFVPCRNAFIDAHTPGSDRKENFTIIGAGVSESADQHVHVRETPGFNIGAAHCHSRRIRNPRETTSLGIFHPERESTSANEP